MERAGRRLGKRDGGARGHSTSAEAVDLACAAQDCQQSVFEREVVG